MPGWVVIKDASSLHTCYRCERAFEAGGEKRKTYVQRPSKAFGAAVHIERRWAPIGGPSALLLAQGARVTFCGKVIEEK